MTVILFFIGSILLIWLFCPPKERGKRYKPMEEEAEKVSYPTLKELEEMEAQDVVNAVYTEERAAAYIKMSEEIAEIQERLGRQHHFFWDSTRLTAKRRAELQAKLNLLLFARSQLITSLTEEGGEKVRATLESGGYTYDID